jgi:hypothetical protein
VAGQGAPVAAGAARSATALLGALRVDRSGTSGQPSLPLDILISDVALSPAVVAAGRVPAFILADAHPAEMLAHSPHLRPGRARAPQAQVCQSPRAVPQVLSTRHRPAGVIDAKVRKARR